VFLEPMLTDAKLDNLAELLAMPRVAVNQFHSSSSKRPAWWQPGVVVHAEENLLVVAAGEGAVRIDKLQPAGKKMMQVQDFLHGYPMKQGDRLVSAVSAKPQL